MPVSEFEARAARAALGAFDLPADARVDFIKYRENHVYRVRADGVDLALRMHRPGYRSDDDLRAEVAVLAALRDAGIPLPAPRRTRLGDDLAVVADDAGTRRQATMLGWFVEAEPMGDSAAVLLGDERPADLRRLGRLIADLHAAAGRFEPTLGAGRPAWDAAGLAGPVALWGSSTGSRSLDAEGRAVLRAAEDRLALDLAALPRERAQYGYIHADLTFENVLSTPDGLVAIDFDDSGPGWFLFDLATPYLWCTMHPAAPELLAELVEGYQQVRALTAADADAWDSLLLARALSYLGWSAARPGDPVSEFHETHLVPWVLAAAREYLATGRTGWPGLRAFIGPQGESGAS